MRAECARGDEPGQKRQPVGGGFDLAQFMEQHQAVKLDAAGPEEVAARDRAGGALGDAEMDAGPTGREHR